MQDMTAGNPLRLIVTFSIPLLIGNFFQQLYSISDIIIVGRMIGINALAAVGAVAPIFFLLVMFSIGFASGLTVITAQRFGAKDYLGMRRSVAAAVILSTISTLLCAITVIASLTILFKLMNIPAEISEDARIFISIIAGGVIMIMFFNLLSGFIRALGDSRTPLYFLIIATLLNITFNLFYIGVFKMGVAGSALGTITAMSISVILCLIHIKRKFPLLHPQPKDWKPDWAFYKKHLKIAVPMALQFSILAVSVAISQSVCNSFGAVTIAAFVSAFRVEQLAMQPMISFGVAMATYTAQNYGAGMITRIRRGVRECSKISLCLSIFLGILMYLFSTKLVAIFISKEDIALNKNVLDIARTYIKISVPFYFFLGQIFIFRNALQGMGNAIVPLASSIAELFLRSFSAIVLAASFGYIGICMASPISWIAVAAITSVGYFSDIRKIGKKYLQNRRKLLSHFSKQNTL